MAEITLEMELAFENWLDKFKPIKNHINLESSFDGEMFETYGDEYKFVTEQPHQNVWTWVDGDTGTWIVNGLHIVNRIGYFVTENPCEEELVEIQVDTYTNTEENN